MIVQRIVSLRSLLLRTGFHLTYLILYAWLAHYLFITLGYDFLAIPWMPVSLVGIAVSFYVGFKNNSAYDRNWEARKIYGSIVNMSRAFGSMARHFISTLHAENFDENLINKHHKALIHRHIAWLYQLRSQLLKPAEWEHTTGNWAIKKLNLRRRDQLFNDFPSDKQEDILKKNISKQEIERLQKSPNPAISLIDFQSQELKSIREQRLIDDFRHMELQKLLNEFYTEQGKLERIKNFPLPRTYASVSYYFVAIFVLILPFALIPEFAKLAPEYGWLMIPFSALISWIFVLMELVGDYTENPFEGLPGDIPMLAITRTIERDLLAMLGEENLPPTIQSKKFVQM